MASPFLTQPIEGGKYYHIYKTSSYSGPLFFTPANYQFFLKRFQLLLGPMVDLMAYCLLPDRFHFVFYARELITLKEEFVDHPGDIGHFISETLRKLFSTYTVTLIKQEGLGQDVVVLDQNFYRFEIPNEELLKQIICGVHLFPKRINAIDNLTSFQSLTGTIKSMADKEFVHSLFGDVHQFTVYHQSFPDWKCSPLFEL